MKKFDIRADEILLKEGYWLDLQKRNLNTLLFQWAQLEKRGIINNFRICAKEIRGRHTGISHNDAALYQWMESASSLINILTRDTINIDIDSINIIKTKLEESINLIKKCQTNDGYIFTYHQIDEKPQRWKSLFFEKELYCLGALIKSGITHFGATQQRDLIEIAQKAAELVIREILSSGKKIPGFPEIEYALILLYDKTGNERYLEAAEQFIKNRNQSKNYFFAIIHDGIIYKYNSLKKRIKINDKEKKKRIKTKAYSKFNKFKNILSRNYYVIGSSHQKKNIPHGEAIRYLNFRTAEVALINRYKENKTLHSWLSKREKAILQEIEILLTMYIDPHGTTSDFPPLKGFHPMYVKKPQYGHGKSCSASSIIYLSMELFRLTKEALYADIIEWEYSNAISATFNTEGKEYYSHQPIEIGPEHQRINNQDHPDEPIKISQAISKLDKFIYHEEENDLYILQFPNHTIDINRTATWIELDSNLPYGNEINIRIVNRSPREYNLHIRIPSWAEGYVLYINGKKNNKPEIIMPQIFEEWKPHFHQAGFLTLAMNEKTEAKSVKIIFSNTIKIYDPRPILPHKTKEVILVNKQFIARNSFLYCLEDRLNHHLDFFTTNIDLNQKSQIISRNQLIEELKELSRDLSKEEIISLKALPDNMVIIEMKTKTNEPIFLIPWAFHGNNGSSNTKIIIPATGGIGNWDN